MTDNHDQLPPAPSRVPDFIRPFDGSQLEVGQPEIALAAKTFDSFVSDIMLRHVEHVFNRNQRNQAWPINVVDLNKPANGGEWSISIRESILPEEHIEGIEAHDLPRKAVSLFFVDTDGHEREEFSYGLGHDGIVRRFDGGDDWALEQEINQLGLIEKPIPLPSTMSDEVRDHVFKKMFEAAGEARQNRELEMGLGQNNQPVGIDEINGLVEMLTSADVTPVIRS